MAGLALPYGPVIIKGGRRLRFAPGSIQWPAGTVRFLRDHDRAQRLGRAVDRLDTLTGLLAALAVDPGPAGDRALGRIRDGSERGLSVGVTFLEVVRDPAELDVHLVLASLLREISLTATPATGVARLTVWP